MILVPCLLRQYKGRYRGRNLKHRNRRQGETAEIHQLKSMACLIRAIFALRVATSDYTGKRPPCSSKEIVKMLMLGN